MSTWDVARANAATLVYQPQKVNTESHEVAKNTDPSKRTDVTGVVAFENGIYSSCQNGHFEAAA